MAKKLGSNDLSPFGRTDIENEVREFVEEVLHEPKIPTMDRKLIVEAATPGHYPGTLWEHFGIKDMPPCTIEEQATAIIECAQAGAAAIHTHAKDPAIAFRYEAPYGMAMSAERLVEVLDIVYQEVDMVPLNHAWHPKNFEALADADFITPTQELLDLGKGNKYIQGNIVPTWLYPRVREGQLSTWFPASALKEGITYLEENNVKPLIALHLDLHEWFLRNIVDTGVLKTRPHLNIQEGKHGTNRFLADPMSHQYLISMIELVRKTVPDCTIGLHSGGRNWLPMTALAIMLGVDLVRIGIEDQFWACPHKDEIIKKPVESVEKVVQIARALGRDIATPDEAREILGIKVTWIKEPNS